MSFLGLCGSCAEQKEKTEGLCIDIDSLRDQPCQFEAHIERYVVLDTTKALVNPSDKYSLSLKTIIFIFRIGKIACIFFPIRVNM